MNQQLTIPIPQQPGAWTPPPLTAFSHGRILAFDQALNNTGWVDLEHDDTGLHLHRTGLIHGCAYGKVSHEGSYAKAESLGAQVWSLMPPQQPPTNRHVVYERPSMVGQRTESALLAGYSIFKMSGGIAVMVSNRHAKAVIIGRAGTKEFPVTKNHVKEAVEHYLTPPGRPNPWNEHVRDAAMLALTHLYDLAKEPKP